MENSNWEYDYSTLYREQPPQGQQPTPTYEASWQAPQTPKKPKRRMGRKIAAGVLALAVCAGVGAGGGYLGYRLAAGQGGHSGSGSGTVLYQGVQTTSTGTGSAQDISGIVANTAPSVVEITTEQLATDSYFTQRVLSGAGSGVIISEDGYIITNNHVIEGATNIKVTLSNKESYDATLVGADSTSDIAVIKINATGLTPAIMGDSDKLAVGQIAIAIGNPLGSLGGTVTDGIISALDRDIVVEGQSMRLLQTSAAISPGNSGGGLFNANGELIGIVNAKSKSSDSEGLGFAIPINTAKKVAEELINNGYVTGRPALGITVLPITDAQTALRYGVTSLGVYIASVVDGSGAAKAGLQAGDRIVSIEGKEVSSTSDVTGAVQEKKVGDTVTMQIARNGQIMNFEVVLGEKDQPQSGAQSQPGDQSQDQNQLPDNGGNFPW